MAAAQAEAAPPAAPAPWPLAGEARERRSALGCATSETENFILGCEFISLGCYCTVSEAIQYLGLRQYAYPFDWVRSPMEGIIHCVETGFEDFLTYTEVQEKHGLKAFIGSRWGGSFWHHDLEDEVVQADFSRRVERLLGLAEAPPSKPRVFVRLLNSSRELDLALRLKDVLKRVFPSAPIYLLLIVDVQAAKGPKVLAGAEGNGLLVHFMDQATVYQSGGESTAEEDYQTRARVYAAVIAFAIRFWSGGDQERSAVQLVPSLLHLCALCEQYDGGEPAHDLYSPQYFKGYRLAMNRRPAPAAMPKLFHGRSAEFTLPEGVVPGGYVQVNIFGEDVTLRLPDNAAAGHLMKCKLVEGVLTAVMVIAASTAPAIAASLPASLPAGLHAADLPAGLQMAN